MKYSIATKEHDGVYSLDVAEPEHEVEIQIRSDGTVLWVHVDGRTLLRVCRIPENKLTIQDDRKGETKLTRLRKIFQHIAKEALCWDRPA